MIRLHRLKERHGQVPQYTELIFQGCVEHCIGIVLEREDILNAILDYSASQIQEAPNQESLNFMDLSDEEVEKFKVKTLGTEELAGKDCTKFSAETSQMGQTAKITAWVWNGIPMKTVTSMMGMNVTATVSSLEEGPVEASLFELPKF